jgi:DNA-binding HxlR family transcriptional regulator
MSTASHPNFSNPCPKAELRNKTCIYTTTKILGDKWTPLLLFAMATKPRRFLELQAEAGGVNPRTLSARLDGLEQSGIISRTVYPDTPPRVMYALTEKGEDLLPVIRSMIAWAEKYLV